MALASPYPDVEIPVASVPEFVLAAGRERPDAPALIDGLKGDTITHGQLSAYVDRVAANLHARGLRKGDVVAVFCPNTPWYPVVFHGIAAAGMVMSPINSLYTPEEEFPWPWPARTPMSRSRICRFPNSCWRPARSARTSRP